MTWVAFDPLGALPAERRYVLVALNGDRASGYPPSTAVGYLRYSAGELAAPFFVVPGFGRPFIVTHWNDCLGDGFRSPAWPNSCGEHGEPARAAGGCTALTARWCPKHGRCECREVVGGDLDCARCPLHSPMSSHAERAPITQGSGT